MAEAGRRQNHHGRGQELIGATRRDTAFTSIGLGQGSGLAAHGIIRPLIAYPFEIRASQATSPPSILQPCCLTHS